MSRPLSSGNGPECPAGFRHGRMFSRDRGGDPSKGFRCMHSDHGGNGRPFTEKEVSEYSVTEADMNQIVLGAAKAIVAEQIDLETAVTQVARQTKRGTDAVRTALTNTVEALRAEAKEKEATMAEKKAEAAKAAKAPKAPKAEKAPKEPSLRGEHVEPAEFAAVRDALGLRNKEVSAALEAAGMGSTLSRVTELTHSKGSSRALFAKFTDALNAWRAANPAPEAPADEPAAEPAAE